jgi:hypothetical protein
MRERISFTRRPLQAMALALLPMACAALGAWLDQRTHLGFSAWRSACRSDGITLGSLAIFTLDLLPGALIGMALGVVAMQFASAALWLRAGGARLALAAHGGCALGMAFGLWLCTVVPSIPLMLAGELAVTASAALLLCVPAKPSGCRAASVGLPTARPTSAY